MRYYVALVLIICGTLLALTVPVSDVLYCRQWADIVADRPQFEGTTLMKPLDDAYRVSCWSLGGAMIILGIVANGFRRSTNVDFRDIASGGDQLNPSHA